MNCPNCNTLCGETDRFCYRCGTPLGDVPAPQPEKKGSHWVPILILAILSILGTGLYFATADSPADIAVQKPQLNQTSETPWFRVEDECLYFDESLYTGPAKVTVPSRVDGETVSFLAPGCFEDCTGITTVILPDTLLEIGSCAFSGCTSLRGIYIPESVTVIGEEAFYGCTDLEAIWICDSMSYVGYAAFENCDSLWYIFYLGEHAAWSELYSEFINPYTGVYCADGSFYQGGAPS